MPTYSFDATNPLDNSLVSAYPANARAMRGQLTSWAQTEHLMTGRHVLPSGSRATRDALPDKATNGWYWDTDNGLMERWGGAAWTISHGFVLPGFMMVCPFDPVVLGPGWLPADGRAVSQVTYATLFARIGSVYDTQGGQGAPGAGLFRVPRMQNVVVVGWDDGGDGDGDHGTIGQEVGAKKEAIAPATHLPELVVTDPGHTHSQTTVNVALGGTQVLTPTVGATGVEFKATGVRVNVGGSGTPFDKRQLSLVLPWVIKT
jgi:microcystin-dependent protein